LSEHQGSAYVKIGDDG